MSALSATAPGRFSRDQQLDDSLIINNKEIYRRLKTGKAIQSSANSSSVSRAQDRIPPSLPGYPTKYIDNTPQSDEEIVTFMEKEFVTPRLNQMAPRLWLMATKNHSFISPLHEQIVRGRQIIITEMPELHLTWIDDKVFVKPIPAYLTSWAFWGRYLSPVSRPVFGETIRKVIQPAILGFLRSWTYLVRHESDYQLAKKSNLIPRGASYTRFMRFLANFESPGIDDTRVAPRYEYGQLRLSRLNMWAKVFLGHWDFEQVYWQYWQYFQTYYGPLLFIFAVFTVVLSAMQVGMTSPDIWPAFSSVSVWFSVITLFLVAVTIIALATLFLIKGLKELTFALKAVFGRK